MNERSPILSQIQSYSSNGRSYVFEHDGVSGVSYTEGDEVTNGALEVGGMARTETPGLVAVHSHTPWSGYIKDNVTVELLTQEEAEEQKREKIEAQMRNDQL